LNLRIAQSQRSGAPLAALATLVVACSYDFDRFVQEPSVDSPAAVGGAESPMAGRAGAGMTGATEGGRAGGGGAGGRASEEGGAAGEGLGEGAKAASSGAGKGTSSGGGTDHAGSGGKSSGGTKASGAGQGGTSAAGRSTGGAPSSGGAGSSCTDVKGTTYNGHCYFSIGDDSALDWPSAKSSCEAHSSSTHLVTIGSSGEQAMLAQAFFPATVETWIGLSLADVTKDPPSLCALLPDQCPFQWVTGEPLDYADWAQSGSTEPNYSGSCVRMHASDQAWGDTSCTGNKYRAICEEE
jgi:Lectin C-type domain